MKAVLTRWPFYTQVSDPASPCSRGFPGTTLPPQLCQQELSSALSFLGDNGGPTPRSIPSTWVGGRVKELIAAWPCDIFLFSVTISVLMSLLITRSIPSLLTGGGGKYMVLLLSVTISVLMSLLITQSMPSLVTGRGGKYMVLLLGLQITYKWHETNPYF